MRNRKQPRGAPQTYCCCNQAPKLISLGSSRGKHSKSALAFQGATCSFSHGKPFAMFPLSVDDTTSGRNPGRWLAQWLFSKSAAGGAKKWSGKLEHLSRRDVRYQSVARSSEKMTFDVFYFRYLDGQSLLQLRFLKATNTSIKTCMHAVNSSPRVETLHWHYFKTVLPSLTSQLKVKSKRPSQVRRKLSHNTKNTEAKSFIHSVN